MNWKIGTLSNSLCTSLVDVVNQSRHGQESAFQWYSWARQGMLGSYWTYHTGAPLEGCIFTSMMYSSQSERKVDVTFIDKLYAALNIARCWPIGHHLSTSIRNALSGKYPSKVRHLEEKGLMDWPASRYGPPTRTPYRVIVENLSSRISWQVGCR